MIITLICNYTPRKWHIRLPSSEFFQFTPKSGNYDSKSGKYEQGAHYDSHSV